MEGIRENTENPKKGKRKAGGKEANIDLEFAAECKRKREELGATIEAFWKTLGVAKSTGSRYESGQRGVSEPLKLLYRTMCSSKASNALEKYGEDGKKFLAMLNDPAVADLALKTMMLKRKTRKAADDAAGGVAEPGGPDGGETPK